MAGAMTGWRLLVNFLLPPPLLLTFLLVIPFPRNVRKGILMFTSRVLSFTVVGGLKLVHFSLLLSGMPLIDSGFRLSKEHSAAIADASQLTGNQRTLILAKKWREERNFWISAMAFTLWCLLTVLYGQVEAAVKLEERYDALREELDELRGVKRGGKKTGRKLFSEGFLAACAQRVGLGGQPAPSARSAGAAATDASPFAGADAGGDGGDGVELTAQQGDAEGAASGAVRRAVAGVKKEA